MKTIRLFTLLASALFLTFVLVDCDPKEKDEKEIMVPLTSEENKEAIQEIGVEFVNEISTLESSATAQATISLAMLLDLDDDEADPVVGEDEAGSRKSSFGAIQAINQSIYQLTQGKVSSKDVANMPVTINEDDEESLSKLFEENKGIYEWDADADDFVVVTEGGDVIQLNFPATENGTENNASFTVENYKGTTIANPIDEDYTGDLPTAISASLKIDGIEEMNYSTTINYNTNGEPEKMDLYLFMNPFSMSISMTNNTSTMSESYTFTNGNKIIIKAAMDLQGDFSEETVRSMDDDQDNVTQVIKEASFAYQFLNLEIAGTIDAPNFYNAVKDVNDQEKAWGPNASLTQEQKDEVIAGAATVEAALNAHTTVTMKYVDSGVKAADIEWKANTELESEEYSEEISLVLGANMLFEDGSKVDIEDYLSTGFESLEKEINELLDQFSNSIDEEIEPINFD